MTKCPESIEELEAAERHLNFCRAERAGVYEVAKAKIESGAASGWKDAERQVAEETGRDVNTIRVARMREQRERGGTVYPLCETELQAAEWDPDAEEEETYHCDRCSHYDYEKGVCWLHREDAYGGDTCDSWLGWNDDGEAVITKPGIDADADKENEEQPSCSIPHVAQNTGENEWYTPPEFIEAARAVMGGIDCDPASSAIANETVKAEKFFTAEQDGRDKEWGRRVWMNPPYAQPLIAEFSKGISSRYESGKVQEACVLVNNATETGWFQGMMAVAAAVAFIKSRVRFLDPEGNPGAPLQGQCVLYFGENKERFSNEFSRFGIVLFHANV